MEVWASPVYAATLLKWYWRNLVTGSNPVASANFIEGCSSLVRVWSRKPETAFCVAGVQIPHLLPFYGDMAEYGLRRRPGKSVGLKNFRRFESYYHRHFIVDTVCICDIV